jgi:hypothetical protein
MAHKSRDEEDSPWTEAQWEAFMKKGDLRTARYGELLETLIDDRSVESQPGDDDSDGSRFAIDIDPDSVSDEDVKEILEAEDVALEANPAYQIASNVGLKMMQQLDEFDATPRQPVKDDNPRQLEIDRLLGVAAIGCNIAAAKISGGHAMGYEDEVLCGNIVNVRRGLEAVDEGIAALEELKQMDALPAGMTDQMLADCHEVRQAVQAWIDELRSRVWWS